MDLGEFRWFDQFTDGWAAEVGQVGFGEEACSYLALNFWEFVVFELYEAPFAIYAEVNAQGLAVVEVEKHLFADGPSFVELLVRDEFGAG